MRVLLVNDDALCSGGAAQQMLALRDALRRRGHDARLFASSVRPAADELEADYFCFGTTSRAQTLLNIANPWAAWRLRRILADFRPDVVHLREFLWQLSPLLLPVLRGVPTLLHVAAYKFVCPLATKTLPDGGACRVRAGRACHRNGCLPLRAWAPMMAQMWLWRRWRGAVGRVVTVSEAAKRVLVADGFERVDVIPNVAVPRPPRPGLDDRPVAAFAGRLIPIKGADVLVRAFARVAERLPAARLVVAGDGVERARLEGLARDLGLADSVSFTGHLSRADMEARLSGAWAVVVPSCFEEPHANAATEAMMRGVAVVATRAGGLPEIVRDGETGLLVPPRDADALGDALARLLGDRDLAEALGRNARRAALARFGEGAWADAILAQYRLLLGGD
jgi:glycosyltransferase involved in cell wall biosynthesis